MRLVTTSEAAEILGVSQRRVQELARQGRLPRARRVGMTWMIAVDRDGRIRVTPGSRGPAMAAVNVRRARRKEA